MIDHRKRILAKMMDERAQAAKAAMFYLDTVNDIVRLYRGATDQGRRRNRVMHRLASQAQGSACRLHAEIEALMTA